jgi:hypothetical protein
VFYINTHVASSILMFCTVLSPSKLSVTSRTKEKPRTQCRGKVNPTPMQFTMNIMVRERNYQASRFDILPRQSN